MGDLNKILDGNVEEVSAAFEKLSHVDLHAIRKIEVSGKNRKGVLEAVDDALRAEDAGGRADGDEVARGVEEPGPSLTTAASVATAADLDHSGPAGIAPATEFDTAGAPQQIVPDVDVSHPAVDNDPRANTTINQNKIDFNDPTRDGVDVVTERLQDQAEA